MKIIVAGPGCGRCHATEKNVKEAAKALNLQADITHEFDVKGFSKSRRQGDSGGPRGRENRCVGTYSDRR